MRRNMLRNAKFSMALMVSMVGLVMILSIGLGVASKTTAPSAIASEAVGGSKAQQGTPTAGGAGNVPGELLVRFRPNVPASEQAKIHGQAGASMIRSLLLPRAKLVRLHGMQNLSTAIRKYESHPQVEYAEPNSTAELASVVPNDTYFPRLWALDNTGQTVNGVAGTPVADIGAQEAWDTTTGNASVTVGVADSGVDYNNPDLSPRVVPGYDFVDNDTDVLDDVWHGTFVTGIIGAAGNNGYGVTGVDWHVGLAPLRICSLVPIGGVPPVTCTAADQADAYTYAGKHGMAVVNASLNSGKSSKTVYNAIKGASNTLFVAASGNQKSNVDNKPQYPCSYDLPNVVCVGATDQHDALAPYSNYGASNVDLAAPGTNIWSIYPFVTSYSEAFSTDLSGRWTTGGINNTWARFCVTRKNCFLQDSPGGNYLNDTDSWTQTTTPASTVGGNHCQVQYDLKGVVASGDELRASVSSTGSTWTRIGTWSGSLTSWKTAQYPLSGFGGDESVYIRLELVSNSSGTADGVSIDNVKLNCLRDPGTYQDNEYAFSNGTSFATAYVSGAAALLKAHNPAATAGDIKRAILDGVDSRSSLAGKTVTGGRLDIQRSLTLLPDATAPAAPAGMDLAATSDLGSSDSDNITSDATPTFNGTAEAGATVRIYAGANLLGETAADGTGNWNFTPGDALSDNTYSITATATDRAGNTSPPSEALSVTIDTAAPVAPVITIPADNSTYDSGTFTVSGTAEQNSSVELFDDLQSQGKSPVAQDGGWSIDLVGVTDGEHTYMASATDVAGNTSVPSDAVRVTVDTGEPAS